MFKLKRNRINPKKIDSGASGAVFPYQKDPNDFKWVVKRIHADDADEVLNSFPEIVLGFSCDHPCIVPLKGYSIQKDSEGGYYVYLKFPRMKGSLKNRFEDQQKNRSPFSEQEIVQYFYSLVSAVEYLHRKKIYHRDIKPANIVLDNQGNAKLCDIGVAKYVGEEEIYQELTGQGGTAQYIAPEMLQQGQLTKESLRANDIWSIGLVILELCALDKRILNPLAALEKIKETQGNLSKKLKEIYSGKLVDLIFGLLNVDPNERMKIVDIKKKLEEDYNYCKDFETSPEKDELNSLKEHTKRLNQKYKERAQGMLVLVETLKKENIKLKNDLKEYRSSVSKLHSQLASDISKRYNETIERLKVQNQALNHEEMQKRQSQEEKKIIKPVGLEVEEEEKKSFDLGTKDFNSIKMEHKTIRVALFGGEGSGRHSFILRLTENRFSEKWFSHSFHQQEITKKLITLDGKELTLSFEENLSEQMDLMEMTFDDCNLSICGVFLAFYNITNRRSFKNLERQSSRFSNLSQNKVVFIVGTKLDLESQRQVTKMEAEGFARENGAVYCEISSKTEENFWEFQEELTKAIFQKYLPSAGLTTKKATEPTIKKKTDQAIEKKKSSFWGLFDN